MASSASGLAPARERRRPEDGRPSGLERIPPKVRTEILARIEKGAPFSKASASCGVPYRTFERWCQLGREENAREPYRSFAAAVDRAFAQFVVNNVMAMDEGAKKDWRAALEMLKRRSPDEWGDPDRGGTTVNVAVIQQERSDAAARLLEAAARVLGGQPELLEALVAELAGGDVVEGQAAELPEAAG